MPDKRLAVYQIEYDERSRAMRDPGFLPLDNLRNPRPDWFEYWPIRQFLRSAVLPEDGYCGFFSPKFHEKTGLTASQVLDFARQQDADIVSFSPYFDQSAFALNIFEQARANHPGIETCFDLLLEAWGLQGLRDEMVMTAEHTIFCNYFVARRSVWETWLQACEKVFAISEAGDSALAQALNQPVPYARENVAAKVFVIERMISLLIFIHPSWKVVACRPSTLPMTASPVSAYPQELLLLNALKTAYRHSGETAYMAQFFSRRAEISEAIEQAAARHAGA